MNSAVRKRKHTKSKAKKRTSGSRAPFPPGAFRHAPCSDLKRTLTVDGEYEHVFMTMRTACAANSACELLLGAGASAPFESFCCIHVYLSELRGGLLCQAGPFCSPEVNLSVKKYSVCDCLKSQAVVSKLSFWAQVIA